MAAILERGDGDPEPTAGVKGELPLPELSVISPLPKMTRPRITSSPVPICWQPALREDPSQPPVYPFLQGAVSSLANCPRALFYFSSKSNLINRLEKIKTAPS